jgi:hypothetical protein
MGICDKKINNEYDLCVYSQKFCFLDIFSLFIFCRRIYSRQLNNSSFHFPTFVDRWYLFDWQTKNKKIQKPDYDFWTVNCFLPFLLLLLSKALHPAVCILSLNPCLVILLTREYFLTLLNLLAIFLYDKLKYWYYVKGERWIFLAPCFWFFVISCML